MKGFVRWILRREKIAVSKFAAPPAFYSVNGGAASLPAPPNHRKCLHHPLNLALLSAVSPNDHQMLLWGKVKAPNCFKVQQIVLLFYLQLINEILYK